MTSLADLFNPTFFIILGIVTLFVALTIVYFESKMREQNHKIASMLSLVSTLAEDVTSVKMGLNHLAVNMVKPLEMTEIQNHEPTIKSMQLIDVSEDEESIENEAEVLELEDELEELEDEELEDEELDEDEELYDELDDDDLDNEEIEELDDDELDNEEIEELDCNNMEEAVVINMEEDVKEEDKNMDDIKVIKYELVNEDKTLYSSEQIEVHEGEGNEEKNKDSVIPSVSELKTISINLGGEEDISPNSEHIEFKKLGLSKLRSIAIEKGLVQPSDAQKLKKHELLKILGVEN